jgi:hypothetical protein
VAKVRKEMMVQVTGQPPLETDPALFCNFVGISRVASEVQFEFIFLDLNQVAQMLQSADKAENTSATLPPIAGKTVVKVIMPSASFVQLKPHLEKIFTDIQNEMHDTEPGDNADASLRKSINT